MPNEKTRVIRRQFQGDVVGVPKDKTIHVLVKSMKVHPKYQKRYARSYTYAVHDEKNEARAGDRVSFQECRPLSKTKRWRLIQIL
ncbi:MAG: 30S ribosomal protein S17 [Candidatus Magasanikbacteria bacterium RIFCSPHIGHO2_02_FULL_51_14]|uniref:Small ribosomal subunit protein uS17 n=1 Tax=Candidatus Magasanikbacteria bacterium RIFCSPHIGHO2_02_FULL_51_14 TaxID=1798683 RepID=A0A1F6MHL8_9BACT|nr:MAG: 30S ribosomal protein S17 [Candidatus Magasanikbacteria bacterium RIFCSPHIGHO2_02_FULL_51_14]